MTAGWRQMGRDDMLRLLSTWAELGWLRQLDRAFAVFIDQQNDGAEPLLILAAALASHQLGRGHVCLDLPAALADPRGILSLPPENESDRREAGEAAAVVTPDQLLAGLDVASWLRALNRPEVIGVGDGTSPLVRVDQRLYLRRYWGYERAVRDDLARRLDDPALRVAPASPDQLRSRLEVLFPAPIKAASSHPSKVKRPPLDWQKIACALAVRSPFAIITGGPGTGKTTTVVRLLALLQSLAIGAGGSGSRGLRIKLAAPTGKAAARLNQTLAGAVSRLVLDGLSAADLVRDAIPTRVTTLHRLLGSRPDTRRLRHDARHPLSLDVLVVDEASMIDLEMMANLLAALPAQARLILLGDKDQLASVEAGAVLGELCADARDGHYRPETVDWLTAVTGTNLAMAAPDLLDPRGSSLAQAVVMLRDSHRFDAASGIGRLADRVNAGDVVGATRVCDGTFADVISLSAGDPSIVRALVVDGAAERFLDGGQGRVVDDRAIAAPTGYRAYLDVVRDQRPAPDAPMALFDRWATEVLATQGRFQLLCALRGGSRGVWGMNRRVETLLHEAGLIEPDSAWYLGRPVMVTRNDYGLGLMNGDVGVTLCLPNRDRPDGFRGDAAGWTLRVAFIDGADSTRIRWVLPSRLQAVETVFAMTVHKAQGSEFSHAALVLPERINPILTRELLYTGITRARHWFSLLGDGVPGTVFDAAVQRRVHRASGLMRDG